MLLYKVRPYSIDELCTLLVKHSSAKERAVKEKSHCRYFEHYFSGINAQTIIVEPSYIDHDYLEDFANYYVKCFRRYTRKCTRLHFFNIELSQESFDELLKTGSPAFMKRLQESYLGFIVIKNLPETIIGRTCLRSYPEDSGRFFPVNRKYTATLFGIRLTVNSLAYQEQDQVAAACASSALWTIFHKTGVVFQHPIPSPIEITKDATFDFPTRERSLPNTGLSIEQMIHSIRTVGLEPLPVQIQDEYILKRTLYAYMKSGLPIALNLTLVDTSKPIDKDNVIGHHTVAVTGYCLGNAEPDPLDEIGFLSKSTRINKIYVHDDQVGPFARMEFDDAMIQVVKNGGKTLKWSLSTSWVADDGSIDSVRAVPIAALLPLYHKIRIPLNVVETMIVKFDAIIEICRTKNLIPLLNKRLQWDVHLSCLNDFKTELLKTPYIESDYRRELLITEMPRFIWRAIALKDDMPLIELIFDATDIAQGNFFIQVVKYNPLLFTVLKKLFSLPNVEELIGVKGRECHPILDWFLTHD